MKTERYQSTLLAISGKAFWNEAVCVQALLPHTEAYRSKADAIFARAEKYVHTIRVSDFSSGVEGFMQQYGLEKREGIAVMCLAEALLRIPDAATADALIHDKFRDTEWEQYLSGDSSLFVNASTWGLMLTGGVMNMADMSEYSVKGLLGKLVGKLGEPVVRGALKKAMEILGSQFVLGRDIRSALKRAKPLAQKGYLFSYDVLGEGARTAAQAEHYFKGYMDAIEAIGSSPLPFTGEAGFISERSELRKPGGGTGTMPSPQPSPASGRGRPSISIKLSALHPRYELTQADRVMKELLPRVKEILRAARKHNMVVSLDAEESTRLDMELELFAALVADPEFEGYNGIGFVLQAYQKRAMPVLEFLLALAREHERQIPVRLVKGAYWDSEIKRAQVDGLPGYPVFTRKSHTDVSYLACAARLLEHPECFYPQFATHNALTVASILEIAEGKEFEFQRLYGMGETFYDQLVGKRSVRIYAPVGSHQELLPYLIRRILENGANTSFVNLVVDESEPIGDLLRNPIARAEITQGRPREDIPLPADIFPGRKNSAGMDFGNRAMLNELSEALNSPLAGESRSVSDSVGGKLATKSPHGVASATPAPPQGGSVDSALNAFPAWNARSFSDRAALLEEAANLYESHKNELIALCVHEAHKTLPDSVAEVREAVDFLRYYAAEARKLDAGVALPGPTGESNALHYTGKGVFACISPWNFPLAIFTGQVAAALVTGNTVIAKPAEQTPRIAERAVALLHEAGIPENVLHFTPGSGEEVGAALTKDPRVAGVVFTGSTETARIINRALAAREACALPTLIAETGGQNCMIVDSTALLETAVDDILLSAFGSAGQRCSASRVLYVQEEVADKLLTMLKGALAERVMGDPADPATDIPPVIDKAAKIELLKHCEKMEKAKGVGRYVYDRSYAAPGTLHFVPPHIFEIPDITMLKREVFGPVLHVIRFAADELEEVIAQVNATGYGLTFGVHSRITERYEELFRKIHAGNVYVNRSMIGAVVGVQPFGGMGLSGTGPKAGGPGYLHRFVHEKTFTVNTAAVGGNLGLLV